MSTSASEYKLLAGTGIRPLSRGTKYREWRLAVIDILAEKGYWDIVSKAETTSGADTATKEKAAKARGLLGRLMDSNHRELYATERDASKLWAKLESHYAGKDQARIWYLRGELSQIRYDNEPMVDYIAKLEKLFHQLTSARETQSEKDKLYILLSNLPIQYHPFRTAISNSPDFETIKYDDICDRLILEHQQLIGETGKPIGSSGQPNGAFLSTRNTNGRGGNRFRRGSTIHQARRGRGRGGYRSTQHFQERFQQPSGNRSHKIDKDSCLYCHEKGHWAKDCPKKTESKLGSASETKSNRQIGAWMAASRKEGESSNWILDSGATHHMSSQRELFTNFQDHTATISIANGGTIQATGIGEIWITVWNSKGDGVPVCLQEVLYIPELGPNNLVSVRCVQQAETTILFGSGPKQQAGISFDGDEIAVAELRGNSYILLAEVREGERFHDENNMANTAGVAKSSATLMQWHQRLGHLGFDDIKHLAKVHPEIEIQGISNEITCEACQIGKQTRKPNKNAATHRSTEPLELIHSDVAGPMAIPSLGGAKYYVLFIDDFSRYTEIYTIKQKFEVIDCFRQFKAQVENQQGRKIKRFRSDGGGEYTSGKFNNILEQAGIVREQSAPYTPEQNGVSERANRTIIGRAKAMLFAAGLADRLWGEAVHTTVYLKNRSPTRALGQGMTPLEAFTGKKANLATLIPFGAKGFKNVPKELRTKWEPNSIPCTFVGYEGTNQFRVLIEDRIHITRDLVLAKSPSEERLGEVGRYRESNQVQIDSSDEESDDMSTSSPKSQQAPSPQPEYLEAENITPVPQTPSRNHTPGEFPRDSPLSIIHVRPPTIPEPAPQEEVYAQRPRRQNAGKFSSTRFRDEQFSNLAMQDYNSTQSKYKAYHVLTTTEPATYSEALTGPNKNEWKEVINEELDSLAENKTWIITTLPKERTPVKCKWVFREKKGSAGETIRYKARLVAKGFTQQYGIDYLETYAPVVKLTSLRILLAIAAANNYEIHQGDIKTAYLLGELTEEIYMDIPEGVPVATTKENSERLVCRLLRGLYGLKQSGRIWNKAWDEYLIGKCEYQRSSEDYAVYYRKGNHGTPLWILIWVDDVLWIGNPDDIQQAKRELNKRFPLKDLGSADFFLGMKITRQPMERKIILSQDAYIAAILERFNLTKCHPVSTPIKPGAILVTNGEPDAEEDETLYRSMLVSIMYLMLCTRPDLAFAVGRLSKFSANPNKQHMQAARRLLRYVSKTRNFGLHFGPFTEKKNPIATMFSDADWAGDKESRPSTGAYVCTISENQSNSPHTAISWSSKQQSTIALSSTEAEYMALTQASKEGIWVRRFMDEISRASGEDVPATPMTIFADNQGSMALAKNPEFHSRTKHISIQQHFIREKVESKEVRLEYLPTGDMLADLLTKALPREKVERFRQDIGIYEI